MANTFSIEKAKKTNLKRLAFLPRIGIVVDFGGRQFVYRHAPILETIVNMKKKEFSLKTLMDISMKQLNEITLPKPTAISDVLKGKKEIK